MRHKRWIAGVAVLALAASFGAAQLLTSAEDADAETTAAAAAPAARLTGRTTLGGADPSVIKVGGLYVTAKAVGGGVAVRTGNSLAALVKAPPVQVWRDTRNLGEVWAPEIVFHQGRYHIYFAAGRSAAHRMYAISSASPTSGYTAAVKMSLPGNQWAIDGIPFTFKGQRWFVWSGWSDSKGVEQNLYVARMSSPTATTGGRFIISQPREPWERVVGNPFINEGPQPIVDPNGQLHVVYSANGSWSSKYCLGDLRLRAGGNPAKVWDWYKSNGCLFGSHAPSMMKGWETTRHADGPGHHSFVLENGDVAKSPSGGNRFQTMYHAVAKGTSYSWSNRSWYGGTAVWWGGVTYKRAKVPGATSDTGYGLKFFE